MDKFRYGTKEIIATLSGVLLMAIARYVHLLSIRTGIVDPHFFEWISPTLPIIALAAAFFGPIAGLLCGVGGELLLSAAFTSVIDYPNMISMGFYGLFVGLYFGKMHFDRKVFTMAKFLDFNAVQIMVGIFCGMFLMPVLRFAIDRADLYKAVVSGAKITFGNTMLVGIFCSFVMLLVSIFSNAGAKAHRA